MFKALFLQRYLKIIKTKQKQNKTKNKKNKKNKIKLFV